MQAIFYYDRSLYVRVINSDKQPLDQRQKKYADFTSFKTFSIKRGKENNA